MAIIEDNILSSFLPTIYVSKIVLNNNNSNLELFMADSIEGEELTSFLNDEVLKDCLNIAIFQSTNPEYTEQILNNDKAFNKIDLIDEDGTKREISTEKDFSINNLNLKVVSFKDLTYNETDQDGNKIYYYTTDFLIPENVDNLSYVVYSQLNLDSLSKKFNISFSNQDMVQIPKKTTIQDVIENGEILTKNYNFLLPNGQLWTGEVVEINNQYKTLETNSRTLQVVEVDNYKVQDFRTRKEIQKNIVSEQFEDLTNELINRTNDLSIKIKRKPATFSWFNKIVNSNGTVSISMLINTEQLILENCLYPKLLTPQMLNDLKTVSYLSLWRRQIKSYNNGIVEIDENAEPFLVTNEFDKYQVNINSKNKHFLITDNNIINSVDGLYQYGIQISFNDPTIAELKNRLITTKQIRKNILEYYNFCQLYVDPNTGNFKQIISEVWDKKIIEEEHISIYIKNSFFNERLKNKVFQSLKNYTSPVTGNLEGIYLFIKLLDDLIQDIVNILEISGISNVDLETNEENLDKESTKQLASFTKYFDSAIYDSAQYSKLQLNYLDITEGKVLAEQFTERIYPETTSGDIIYLAPKSLIITNDKFDFISFEDTNVTFKQDKYLLLKNKLLELSNNDEVYTSTDDLQVLKTDIGQDENKTQQIYESSNKYIENFLFDKHSVIVEDIPSGSELFVKYDKVSSLNKIFTPDKTVKILNNFTDVNILKNIQINLSNVEDEFKYRMLVRVEYAVYTEEIKTILWKPLTLSVIQTATDLKQLNLLCRLVPYDYMSVDIGNINNYQYSNTFVLSLSDFSFVRKTISKSATEKTKNPVENLSSELKNIEFLDSKIAKSYKKTINIIYNGTKVEDFYCFFEDNINKNSSLKLEKNMFSSIKKGQSINLIINFVPFQQQSFSTNLIIRGEKYQDILKIPITANTIEESTKLSRLPIKTIDISDINFPLTTTPNIQQPDIRTPNIQQPDTRVGSGVATSRLPIRFR